MPWVGHVRRVVKHLLLGIGVAIALVAAGAWLRHRDAGEVRALDPERAPNDAPLVPEQLELPDPHDTQAPIAGGVAAVPSSDGASASLAGSAVGAASSDAPTVSLAPAVSFAETYAGRRSGDLMEIVRDLHERIQIEAEPLFDSYHRAGRYTTLVPAADAAGRPQSPERMLPPTDLLRKVYEDPGSGSWHVVEIPRAEHAALYRLWDEKRWLVERIEELERVDED